MVKPGAVIAFVCAGLLVACGSGGSAQPNFDIAKVTTLKSSFGPEFTVRETAKTGIDPQLLTGQKLPDGLTFDPPACAKFAAGQLVPAGTEGNMAAVTAQGEGNRFIVIAVETNSALPVTEPGPECQKVTFAGSGMRGLVERVEAPHIDGTQTIGVHRVLQAMVDNQARTGETYNFSAHFGAYQVIVSANPLVLPDKPVVPVNTQRARDLLITGVNAVRS
ncbi:DUF5642 family protein [Mycobacterium sp. CVI_P3]|uniref:DUF5642 family protein n=1 Tax=Mycobacterium pinniadriaticum TaxID=2994102 RepID=A0ABT3SDM6_9MYCO|nr:DUF5642 family protein [Mycobacterium pinniadriaticum]MCX2931155.1 DUF5642 family protein [Mycobacterium pinniadriaticum]MCX2937621.1 DUF5642 family protein [Mycobacterium pinniadriaticum]